MALSSLGDICRMKSAVGAIAVSRRRTSVVGGRIGAMIDRITGTILSRGATDVVLDVNGVGYRLEVSLVTSEALADRAPGARATLLAHLQLVVNNDPSIRLFGFATDDE